MNACALIGVIASAAGGEDAGGGLTDVTSVALSSGVFPVSGLDVAAYDEVQIWLENITTATAGLAVRFAPEIDGIAVSGVVDWYVSSDGGTGDIDASEDSFLLVDGVGLGGAGEQLSAMVALRPDPYSGRWHAWYRGAFARASSVLRYLNGVAIIDATGPFTGFEIGGVAALTGGTVSVVGVKYDVIATQEVAAGVIEVTGLDLTGEPSVALFLDGITTSDDGVDVDLQFQTSGGWQATDYAYVTYSGNLADGGDGQSKIRLALVGNAAGEVAAGRVDIFDPAGAAVKGASASMGAHDAAGNFKANAGTGEMKNTDAITGIRIAASAGTLLTGRMRLVRGA